MSERDDIVAQLESTLRENAALKADRDASEQKALAVKELYAICTEGRVGLARTLADVSAELQQAQAKCAEFFEALESIADLPLGSHDCTYIARLAIKLGNPGAALLKRLEYADAIIGRVQEIDRSQYLNMDEKWMRLETALEIYESTKEAREQK